MHRTHHRWTSDRHTPTVLLRLAALTAVAFALVAASVSALPAAFASSPAPSADAAGAPQASAAAAKCVAQMQKGKKFVYRVDKNAAGSVSRPEAYDTSATRPVAS